VSLCDREASTVAMPWHIEGFRAMARVGGKREEYRAFHNVLRDYKQL